MAKKMRIKLKNNIKLCRSVAMKNSVSALFSNAVNILTKFVVQKVFIEILGIEYLGLNGILTNIVAALNIVELGISTAIIYNLYEPLKNHKIETVKSLLRFYKKAYNIVALLTAIIGIVLMPFLHFIIHDTVPGVNIYIAYILVLFSSVISYFLSYRQSLLYASQRGYIITNIQTVGNILIAGMQILLLILTRDFYLYLSVKIVVQLLQNIVLHKITAKKYSELCRGRALKLEKKIEKDIFQKMRALFMHKIGSFIVFSTDNIVISAFINVVTVGLYSNYSMIISALEGLFARAIRALTPTVGNLLVDKNYIKNYKTFCKIRNVNFVISLMSSAGIMLFAGLFVKIWLGGEYILSDFTVGILVLVHFQKMMRESFSVFKEGAGIYHEDRFVPLIESLINIIASVILVQAMGLPGVFIGTFLSSLVLWFYSYPRFVYRRLFRRSYWQYAIEVFVGGLMFAAIMAVVLQIKNIVGL